jgi:hypothetical protein
MQKKEEEKKKKVCGGGVGLVAKAVLNTQQNNT